MTTTQIRITYAGRLALTTAQIAARHGMTLGTARQTINRLVAEGKLEPLPEQLDGRTKIYPASAVNAAIRGRPGRGVNLRGHG